jgi:polysaccharide chain length determinant protein (PEP-CTERM system associated)
MREIVLQIQTVARGMWRFRWAGLVTSWIIAVVGVAILWRVPDQFEASARIYVDTDSILKPLMSGLAVQPDVQQQINMLSRTLISRPNIEKLIRMADLDLKNESKADQEKLVERLTTGIQIRNAGGVNLYTMAYRDPEPEKAKRVIQSMVSIFVESGLGASRKDTDSAKTFLGEQIKAFETKLEEAEARMKEFRLRNIDRRSADGKDVAQRMSEVQAQLDASRLQLREAEQARDAAKRQIAAMTVGARDSRPNLSAMVVSPQLNVSTPEIDARIDAQKRNLDALLQRYTERHPDVVGTRRLLADLEEQRAKEVLEAQRRAMAVAAAAPTLGGLPTGENMAAQEASRMVVTSEVQVAAARARVDEFSARMGQLREALKTAPQIEAEAAQLNRDYEITKKNYEDLVSRRQSAVMSGELDVASGMADFKLIDPPRVSPKPVAPDRLVLLPMVLVAAVAGGLGLSFAVSQLRPTFSDSNELRSRTGLPVLGVVTMVVGDDDRRVERLGLIRFAAASGGLVGLFVAGLIAMSLMGRYAG